MLFRSEHAEARRSGCLGILGYPFFFSGQRQQRVQVLIGRTLAQLLAPPRFLWRMCLGPKRHFAGRGLVQQSDCQSHFLGKGSYEAVGNLIGSGLGLMVIGGAKESENAALRDYGDSLGVTVRVLSGIDSESMRAVMRNSAAIIGLAHGEAFGLTPIEAMALGSPPVFVNEGGYTETIEIGRASCRERV